MSGTEAGTPQGLPQSVPQRGSAALRVAVLAGGTSGEREVSLAGGRAVADALTRRGHAVCVLDPAVADLETYDLRSFDVVFPVLHGTFGEDGTVQQILQRRGILFPGSGPAASALAFHKWRAKQRFLECGVPTPPAELVTQDDAAETILQAARRIGFPLVVKPEAQGSSLGVTIDVTEAGLPAALAEAFRYGRQVLLERQIPGTEWTAGFVEEMPLPPIRIAPAAAFYDYEAKYESEATRFDVAPTDVDAGLLKRLQQAARDAVTALGVSGISRVDLRVDPDGRAWVLEVNTIPGMTEHSLIPQAAAAIGWDLGTLCERVLRDCLKSAGAARGG